MANWTKGDKPNLKTGASPAPRKAPRSYESHPGTRSFTGSGPTARTSKGNRHPGVGAKNQDLRAKM